MKGHVSRSLVVVLALLAGFTAVVLPAAAEDLTDTLVTIEKGLWQAWADGDRAPFAARMTEDSLLITPGGVATGREAIADMIGSGDCEVRSWSISSPAVHKLTDDVAILTYDAEQDATCGGEDASGKMHTTSVYVHEDGGWMSACHQETMAAGAMDGMDEE